MMFVVLSLTYMPALPAFFSGIKSGLGFIGLDYDTG